MSSPTATILCVDDDPAMLALLDRVFAKHPYTILHAQESDTALRLVDDRSDLDLILLDIMLPGQLNGLQICQQIRAKTDRSYVPIIMLTALSQPDQIAAGLDAGADDYITKPFSPREALARVQAALRLRRAQRELEEAQRRYRVLVETSRDVIFALDTAGQLTYISPACLALTGYSAEELLADQAPLARIVHPDDTERVNAYLSSSAALSDSADLEFRLVRRDEQTHWTSLLCAVICNAAGAAIGLQGTLRDIHQRKQIEAATWQRSQELSALNLIATRVNQSLELHKTLGEALDALMEVLGIEFGTIHVLEDAQFNLRAARGLPDDIARNWHHLLGTIDPDHWQARDPIVLRADSIPPSDSIGTPEQALGIRAWIVVPLRQRGALNGLLILASRNLYKFDQTESTLIGTVAEEISVAITNSRLYEETRQRVEELGLLYEVGSMLASTLDLDKVLRVIMEAAVTILQGEAGSVLLLDEPSGDLVFAAAVGRNSDQLVGLHLPAGAGIAHRVLTEGRSLLIGDAQHDEHFYTGIDQVTGLTTQRLIAAPLRTRGRIIGVMEVINKPHDQFSEADLRILDLLAPTAASAIENARLHTRDIQLTEEIRRHNSELSALHAISAAVSQSLEIKHVLEISLMMMQPLFGYDEGSIALLDGNTLKSMAMHTSSGRDSAAPDRLELADRFSQAAIEASAVKIIANTAELTEEIAAVWREKNIGAMAAVPLWGHDHVQGALRMIWHTPRSFTDETSPLLAAIGQQIGVAIERAHLYEVAQRRAKEIEQSYAQLVQSEKLAATGRLAMSLAHEINNPLQAIQNCLHLALEFDLNESQRTRYLKLAREEVERLSILVQRMLDFYRPSQEEKTVADVHAVLDRVLALTEQKLRHDQIELLMERAADKLLAQAAPDQLGQVFLNLIVNAAEAMDAGGQLHIRTELIGDWIETRFIDTGPGISAEQLAHIFEPFYTTKPDGTGLGLAISYTIIERSGGSIIVESQEGHGSTFLVRLPRAPNHQS